MLTGLSNAGAGGVEVVEVVEEVVENGAAARPRAITWRRRTGG